MNSQKRLANTPPKGNDQKKIDQNSTPEIPNEVNSSTPDGACGFSSSSLPLYSNTNNTKSTSSLSSTTSRVSARLMMPKKGLDQNLVDGIPGHFFGGKRDVMEVEIISINDQPVHYQHT